MSDWSSSGTEEENIPINLLAQHRKIISIITEGARTVFNLNNLRILWYFKHWSVFSIINILCVYECASVCARVRWSQVVTQNKQQWQNKFKTKFTLVPQYL